MTDVHSPDQFRSVTVRNLDGWYAAFEVETGDKLYLAPTDRVSPHPRSGSCDGVRLSALR
jgi:predicted metalloendopeptidase